MIDHYDWAGGREAMLRFGPADGPVIVAALPLFEEANRTRTFVVALLRALAERGIAGALPDLPGQGESCLATEKVSLMDIRDGFEAACARIARPVYALGIRSGALLDTLAPAEGRWHFASQSGPELLRELKRMAPAAASLDDCWWAAADVTEIAGNRISIAILSALEGVTPFGPEDELPLRVVRHESDPKPADLKVPGSPLWRRAEPDNDPALAALLADDIAAWVRACEG
ncbi:hypothetical protein [Sphingomonas sp. M1-B02]|uniref:hypothetical protein n=1 Tax=Sphingomonas sp. M1-B02 TaxID=3114300 RepID=UPI0022406507|nr:hypothetical protein [Sphingomonas sp. S6-11]UZK66485.1 hypothetical protein OKW87_01190 [Sphingomonas sp. S6-11]